MNMKSKTVKSIIDIIIVALIFMMGQVLGGLMIVLLSKMFHVNSSSPAVMGVGLMIGSLFTLVVLLAVRYFATLIKWLEKVDFIAEINPFRIRWKYAVLMVIATMAGVFFGNLTVEFFDVENTLQDTFNGLASNPIAIFDIAILGPVCEELAYRHCMTGGMLRRGVNPTVAIVLPAVLFGIAHLNPAQSFFATWLGLMFGVLYYKSQSIVPSLLLHILNNSLAVFAMNVVDVEANQDAFNAFAGPQRIIVFILMLMCLMTCLLPYIYYMRQPRCPLPEKRMELEHVDGLVEDECSKEPVNS